MSDKDKFIMNQSLMNWRPTTQREPVGSHIYVGLESGEILLACRDSPNNSYEITPTYIRIENGIKTTVITQQVVTWSHS